MQIMCALCDEYYEYDPETDTGECPFCSSDVRSDMFHYTHLDNYLEREEDYYGDAEYEPMDDEENWAALDDD